MSSISVVIPLHNKASSIAAAVRCAVGQTVAPEEVIVVDDGSTDDSVDRLMASRFADSVRVIRQDQQGPGPARNTGWKASRSRWIAFLDADDVWEPDHLETLLLGSRDFPQAEWVATEARVDWGANLRTPTSMRRALGLAQVRSREPEISLRCYFDLALDGLPLPNSSSTMVKRSALEAIGGFPDALPSEDLSVWCALALRGHVAYSTRRTVTVRKDGANITRSLRAVARTSHELSSTAIRRRPDVAVIEAVRSSPKVEDSVLSSAERYVDSLLTRHWITVLADGSQRHAREALQQVRVRRGFSYRMFVLAALLPHSFSRPLAHLVGVVLRSLRFEKPVSPFLDRSWQREGFAVWISNLEREFS